mmetsp:Transcript_21/g.57  ORF Transcript_21/g.57 Transcript_21/m.57 type:complete len:462 (-) Transcript_21:615-2000(-)
MPLPICTPAVVVVANPLSGVCILTLEVLCNPAHLRLKEARAQLDFVVIATARHLEAWRTSCEPEVDVSAAVRPGRAQRHKHTVTWSASRPPAPEEAEGLGVGGARRREGDLGPAAEQVHGRGRVGGPCHGLAEDAELPQAVALAQAEAVGARATELQPHETRGLLPAGPAAPAVEVGVLDARSAPGKILTFAGEQLQTSLAAVVAPPLHTHLLHPARSLQVNLHPLGVGALWEPLRARSIYKVCGTAPVGACFCWPEACKLARLARSLEFGGGQPRSHCADHGLARAGASAAEERVPGGQVVGAPLHGRRQQLGGALPEQGRCSAEPLTHGVARECCLRPLHHGDEPGVAALKLPPCPLDPVVHPGLPPPAAVVLQLPLTTRPAPNEGAVPWLCNRHRWHAKCLAHRSTKLGHCSADTAILEDHGQCRLLIIIETQTLVHTDSSIVVRAIMHHPRSLPNPG